MFHERVCKCTFTKCNGGYDETPKHMGDKIKKIRECDQKYEPQKIPNIERPKMCLSGLDDLVVEDVHTHIDYLFLNIGEKCVNINNQSHHQSSTS